MPLKLYSILHPPSNKLNEGLTNKLNSVLRDHTPATIMSTEDILASPVEDLNLAEGKLSQPSLWSTFRSEISSGTFFPSIDSAADFESGPDKGKDGLQRTNYNTMTQNAFFPSAPKILLCKLLLRGWAISAFILAFTESSYPYYEMAFLTNWSLLVTVIYMGLSFAASVGAALSLSWASTSTDPPSSKTDRRLRTFFVTALSVFFPIAAVQEMVVLLFWIRPMIVDTSPYISIMAHGPLSILVLLDGLLLNAIPVRARQIVFLWVFQSAYIVWSGFYSIFDLVNPNHMMMTMDDAIYRGFLNWRLYPGTTFVFCLLVLFVLTPILFGIVWFLSYHARRIQRSKARARAMVEEWADQTHHPMSIHIEVNDDTNSLTNDDDELEISESNDSEAHDNVDVEAAFPVRRRSSLLSQPELLRSLSVYSAYSV